MRPSREFALLLMLLVPLWLGAPDSQAGTLPSHLAVDVFASGNGIYFDTPAPVEGETLVEMGPMTGGAGGTRPAEVHARAELSSVRLLQVRASSTAPPAFVSGGDQFASAVAGASWRDILLVEGGAAPAEVRFNFSVSGSLSVNEVASASIGFPNVSRSGMLAFADDTMDVFGASLGVVMSGPPTPFAPSVKVEDLFGTPVSAEASAVWSDQSLTSSDGLTWLFSGQFSLVSPLRTAANLGTAEDGYLVAAGLTAGTSMRGSTGESDFFGTMGLDSVTLADGSPLPGGVALAFDSGLVVVPEPGSLPLLALGLLGLTGLRPEQRRAPSA